MTSKPTPLRAAFLTALLAMPVAQAVAAPQGFDPRQMTEQLATMSGMMSVIAVECRLHTQAEVAAMRDEQREASVARGVENASFDRLYAEGVERGRAHLAGVPADEKARTCAEARQQLEQLQSQGGMLR
ncbi:hypothetical protein [Coralloluteibacterium stylophorae]|uniref:DUF4168 domain-containing protein n=1 Tax=Coralloluteibacterium stylophorae TaxID=1776034 RepID=A0A8J7VZ81_9GAMM|nr:hypothetical protein [Coralloluteibacterium stylophorae]MBS7459026.1 hypothetical protein [Coralloluteibacterium stylophorae]